MLKKISDLIYIFWCNFFGKIILRMNGVDFGDGLRLYGIPIISLAKNSSIRIGKNVVLCSNSKFTALGVNHPVVIRTLQPGASVYIGDDVGISGGSICSAKSIYSGDRVLMGANVSIFDNDFHPVSIIGRRYYSGFGDVGVKSVSLGRDVFVGTGAIISKGVVIGDGSVIGAGSVVTGVVASEEIWAGSPARKLKKIIKVGENA